MPMFDYQFENFDPAPDEELICSICRCVFFDPVECPCRHVFCRKCITQWLSDHRTCPTCRKRISKSTLQGVVPLINNIIMKLTLHCRNAGKGCIAKCTVELYESHLKTCDYETIECRNGTCGAVMLRMNKEQHELECPFRSVTCVRCKQKILFPAHSDHDCVRELLNIVQEQEAKIAELKQKTVTLIEEIEKLKIEKEKAETPVASSDFGDLSSMSSVSSVSSSLSPSSSSSEESDVEDYSVRIVSVFHPADSYSMSADTINESQNSEVSVQDINRTEDSQPMDSTNYVTDSPKSSSSEPLDSFECPYRVDSDLGESAGQASSSYPLFDSEVVPQSHKRSLKRRIYDTTDNPATLLNGSTRSSPPRSPIYDNVWATRRSRMSNSDMEVPETFLLSANQSVHDPVHQNLEEQNVTIDILDSSTEDGGSSYTRADLPSSSYTAFENGWNSHPRSGMRVSGSARSFRAQRRSAALRPKEIRGQHDKGHHMNSKSSESVVPHSRVPLPISGPGSSSTPVLSDQEMLYQPVRNRASSEDFRERHSGHTTFRPVLKTTLSLLKKYAGTESDPDWVPHGDYHEESETSSTTTTSSEEKSPRSAEELGIFSPAQEQGRESDSSDYFHGNSESWTTDISETDSSYEVEVPPSTWDLMQRYCNDDSEDSEWVPSSPSVSGIH